MPDKHGFNHLPEWGIVYHRCIHCEWPGYGVVVMEDDRARHHLDCTREEREAAEAKAEELKQQRLANLAKAREAKARQKEEAA